jgi:hypothetical protein
MGEIWVWCGARIGIVTLESRDGAVLPPGESWEEVLHPDVAFAGQIGIGLRRHLAPEKLIQFRSCRHESDGIFRLC